MPLPHAPFAAPYRSSSAYKDDAAYISFLEPTSSRGRRDAAASPPPPDDPDDDLFAHVDFEPLSSNHSLLDDDPGRAGDGVPVHPQQHAAFPPRVTFDITPSGPRSHGSAQYDSRDEPPVSLSTLSADPALLRKQLLRMLSERAEALHILELSEKTLRNVVNQQVARPDAKKSLPAFLESVLHHSAADRAALERKLSLSVAENDRLSCHVTTMRRQSRDSSSGSPCPQPEEDDDDHDAADAVADRGGDANRDECATRERARGAPKCSNTQSEGSAQAKLDIRAVQEQIQDMREEKDRLADELGDTRRELLQLRRWAERRIRESSTGYQTGGDAENIENQTGDKDEWRQLRALRKATGALRGERDEARRERDVARGAADAVQRGKDELGRRVDAVMRVLGQRADDARKTEALLEEQHTLYESSLRETRGDIRRLKSTADDLSERAASWKRDVWKRDMAHRQMIHSLRTTGDLLSKRIVDFDGGGDLGDDGGDLGDDIGDIGDALFAHADEGRNFGDSEERVR